MNITNDLPNVTSNPYLEFQPGDVVYHDNTHDYSTNEPTMDGTASLTFPLAYYQEQGKAYDEGMTDRNVYDQGGIVRGDTAVKKMCLVFTSYDRIDGYNAITQALMKHGVKGNFFFTGKFIDKYPDLGRQLVAAGHYVGSHSYGHFLYCSWSDRSRTLVSKKKFDKDIDKSFAQLSQFGLNKQNAQFFMPPFEYYNSTISAWARDKGLRLVNLTPGFLTCYDYTYPGIKDGKYRDSQSLYDSLMQYERLHTLNGAIIMMHLGTVPQRVDKFYDRLDDIIAVLQAKGYRMVTIDDLTGL